MAIEQRPTLMTFDDPDGSRFPYSVEDPDEPALTIVEAVSQVRGVDELDLKPLQHVIDTDSLSEILNGEQEFFRGGGQSRGESTDLQIAFEYEGCELTVMRDFVHVR